MGLIRRIFYVLFFLLTINSYSTSYKNISDKNLVEISDHIILGKVIQVSMFDSNGIELVDPESRTGPGAGNTIHLIYKLFKNNVIKTNSESVPDTIWITVDNMQHQTLGMYHDLLKEKSRYRLLFLKGSDFKKSYIVSYAKVIYDLAKIIKYLKNKKSFVSIDCMVKKENNIHYLQDLNGDEIRFFGNEKDYPFGQFLNKEVVVEGIYLTLGKTKMFTINSIYLKQPPKPNFEP